MLLWLNALSFLLREPIGTDAAPIVLPLQTVRHHAKAVLQLIGLVALSTLRALDCFAAVHVADVALESEIGKAVGTGSSLVSQTSGRHFRASPSVGDETAAVAGRASEIVVGSAVLDFAVAVLQGKGAVTLLASVVDLLLAAEDGVQETGVVDQRVVLGALHADFVGVIEVLDAILDALRTSSILQDET